MFVPFPTINFLTILSFLFIIVSGNPIKRREEEATGVRISGLFGLFTTVATSALTTGEQVGIVILSSQTIYIQEPNNLPATEWGVPEPTRSSSSSYAAGAVAVTGTFGNTPYSFPTSGFPAASTQVDASSSEASFTDAPAPASTSASSSEDSFTETPASSSASASTDSTLILTPIIEDEQQIATTTTSCNPAIAGVTIPASALTTGEYVAVEVLCEETIYIQEPNFYPTKTWYGISASWTLNTTVTTATSTSTMCNTTVAGVTIPASALTTGELVAVETLCGETIYIQEPNFYPTKTYYGVSDTASTSMTTTSTMSASPSSTTMDVEAQVLNARAGDGVPFFAKNMPTSLRHVNANRIQSVASGGAEAFE
ncbi:hypothetical protein BELL_0831g00020 [Botrytis elliptica]|uniref:LysM domain-containing protein n=1 Tax=Botrytis elliptica TaxID=278938 RepID=A0A4Z1J3Y9_9HELO|nr:hypothetical protein EAE99_005923 [Botrytis elliptica]TGO68429.1 hypothetical protein BELL_0831g00020 [Botrytis elliptica]